MSSSQSSQAALLNKIAWVITVVVLGLVVFMNRVSFEAPFDLGFLPGFHAIVNALTAVVLVYAYVKIRQKQVEAHKRAIYAAVGLSVVFLLSYVAYHMTNDPTLYGDLDHDGILSEAERLAVGQMRTIYLILLLSHIVLAAGIFPFILFTFIRAYTGQFDRHKKMARWVWPVWLYVAVTGPMVYLMLEPYYI
jgi:putative membrane protein